MARTITALFDTRADAEAGGERLRLAGVDAAHVHVHGQSDHVTAGPNSTHDDKGMWASIKHAFLPDADRHTYEEGLRRGGFVLTADVDDDKAAAAVQALEDANGVDLDERSQVWRSEGWSAPLPYAAAGGSAVFGSPEAPEGAARYRSYSAERPGDDQAS